MRESLNLFFGKLFKNIFSLLSFVFFSLDIYKSTFQYYLPTEYQMGTNMTPGIFSILAILFILIASVRTYHELRMKGEKNFYSTNKHARIERAFSVFYHLYEVGKLAQSGAIEQKRKWDQDIIKAIKTYCNNNCLDMYLIATGRASTKRDIPQLREEHFKEGMRHIQTDHLTNNLDHCIK